MKSGPLACESVPDNVEAAEGVGPNMAKVRLRFGVARVDGTREAFRVWHRLTDFRLTPVPLNSLKDSAAARGHLNEELLIAHDTASPRFWRDLRNDSEQRLRLDSAS